MASFAEVFVERLRDHGVDCEIVFLDAENPVLIQRFSETRRRHHVSADGFYRGKKVVETGSDD